MTMKKSTKACEFPKAVRQRIMERDKICVLCRHGYRMGDVKRMGQSGEDFAHIVPRSKLGLGVEQNGILCCRSHHYMLDFTEKRAEMMKIIKGYMLKHYPDWNESELIYKKYDY